MEYVVSLVLLVFCDFAALDFIFVMSSASPCHFVCGVVLLLIFMVFFLFVSCLSFYVLSLGDWLGKRKVNRARGDLCGTR